MKHLKDKMRTLNIRNNSQERLIYQVADWSTIKYLIKNDANPEILSAIDEVIECFIWLYEKGLSLSTAVEENLTPIERLQYERYQVSFSKVREYLQSHMSLLGDFI